MKTRVFMIVAALAVVLQTGCVTGRRVVALPVPALAAPTTSKGEICLTSVVDGRVFENKPPQPSTPSVDGDVGAMSVEQKGTMIGRQRNTYGHAMGDIGLPAGDSVTQLTRLLVAEALKHRGYKVTPDVSAPNTAAVTINEFWAWFTPGMFSVAFEARVYCSIVLKKADGSASVVVKGYGLNRGQVASDGNWQLAYERAFNDFLAKFDGELDKTKF